MISGSVNRYREAVVNLAVRGPQGVEEQVQAVIDTGFDGWLSLPSSLIADLELPWQRRGRVVLADGSETVADIHVGTVVWDGHPRRIPIEASEMVPLIGMSLMDDSLLTVEVRSGGRVTIQRLE